MQHRLSQLIHAFEKKQCEVLRIPGGLRIYFPTLEQRLAIPFFSGIRIFQDQVELKLNDQGQYQWQVIYWTTSQMILHFVASALMAAAALTQTETLSWFTLALGLSAANLIVLAPTLWVAAVTHFVLSQLDLIDKKKH